VFTLLSCFISAAKMPNLIPSAPAQFPGSFASDLRHDKRKSSEARNWKSILYVYLTDGWDDISVWKSAFIEFVGTATMVYLSGLIHTTIGSFQTAQVAGYVGVTNIFLLSLFIYALAPSSGGHVNQMITFTTMTTGLTGFSRGILYLIGQTLGAALAGGLIRGSFGLQLSKQYGGGGCNLNSTVITDGQAFLIEAISSFCMVFLAFGVGLDPRQQVLFGPKLGPFLVACSLGLVSFASVGLAPGYPGAGMNPARCFAFAIARDDFSHQWIWWVGPLTGVLVQSAVYHIAPPYHREVAEASARRKSENEGVKLPT